MCAIIIVDRVDTISQGKGYNNDKFTTRDALDVGFGNSVAPLSELRKRGGEKEDSHLATLHVRPCRSLGPDSSALHGGVSVFSVGLHPGAPESPELDRPQIYEFTKNTRSSPY